MRITVINIFLIVAAVMASCTYPERARGKLIGDGEILLTPISKKNTQPVYSSLLILDYNGDTIKHRKFNGLIVSNLQRWVINGRVRYSYFMQDTTAYHVQGAYPGSVVITDSNLNEINRFHLLPHGSVTTDKQRSLDEHAFILLSDDHYIGLSYYEKNVRNIPPEVPSSPDIKVMASIIQEVKDGKVIWQWDGTDYPESYVNIADNINYADPSSTRDHLHLNSMFIDTRDNNLIVSCRNTNQVLKLDRKTGDIIWRLGGKNSDFLLADDQKFLRQHYATLIDNNNTLLLLDNGDPKERPYSRVLEFQLDEKNKIVRGFHAFKIPAPFIHLRGSVQKFGDKYFIGGGLANYVLEVNYKTGEKTFEKEYLYSPYRALKY